MSIKIGFIGTGGISYMHAEALQRLGEIEITSAHDVNYDSCLSFCSKFGAKAYHEATELIASPDVDAVYICTYHDTHAYFAIKAMECGKAVFLEKPVAMDYTMAKTAYLKQSETNVPCAVGFNLRTAPTTIRLKEIFRKKGVKPLAFKLSMCCQKALEFWAGDPVMGGGILVCLGSHMFDFIEYVLGSEIASVCALTRHINHPPEQEPNSAVILVELKNGLCGTLMISDCAEYGFSIAPEGRMIGLTVFSDEGTFEVDVYKNLRYVDKSGAYKITPPGDLDRCYRWGYEEENRQFIRMLRGEETELCSLAEGAKVAAVVDAARVSSQERRWVEIGEIIL